MEQAFWIFMLICTILIGMYAFYKTKGMDYSAGQGFWKNSEYNMDSNKKGDISDYDPYHYDNPRK